jgi:hypothetical protein
MLTKVDEKETDISLAARGLNIAMSVVSELLR